MKKINIKNLVTIKNCSLALLGVLFLSPVILYAYQFGFGLWPTHPDWSDMGSAIGGIYSPILAFATILLLYKQYELQRKVSKNQDTITICSDAKSEAIYLLEEIKAVMQNSTPPRSQGFYDALRSYKESCSEEDYEFVWRTYRMETLLLQDLFVLLHNLRNLDHPYAKSTFSSVKRKMLGQLSKEISYMYEHYFGNKAENYDPIVHEFIEVEK